MGELAGKLLSWTIKIGFMLAAILAFIAFLNLILLLINATFDRTVLGDLTAMIQMWLPFNLGTIFWWFTSVLNAYLMYRLAIIAFNKINTFLSGPF